MEEQHSGGEGIVPFFGEQDSEGNLDIEHFVSLGRGDWRERECYILIFLVYRSIYVGLAVIG